MLTFQDALVFVAVLLASLSHALAVDFSVVEVAGKRVTVCRVDLLREPFQLFHYDAAGQPFRRFGNLGILAP